MFFYSANFPRKDALFASVMVMFAIVGASDFPASETIHCCMYGVR